MFDPLPFELAVLWAAAAALALWCVLPWFVTAAGGTRYANGGEEDPAAIVPDGSDPAYEAAFADLRTRGYEPLGPAWMTLTPYCRHWVFRTQVRAFRTRAAGRFAFLHETPELPGWHQLYFATCWADGTLHLTCAGFGDARVEDVGGVTEVLNTSDPAAVEARHAVREAEGLAAGHHRNPDLSLDTLLEATRRRAAARAVNPAVDPSVRLARTELFVLALPAGATAFAAALAGWRHWAGPLVALAGFAVYSLLLSEKVARAAAAARATLAARAAPPPE